MRAFFLENWGRKLASLILASTIWLGVNHSLTTTKTLDNISVRLINIPLGLTVEGLQPSGILSKKISLSLQGNKKYLSEVSASDIEVVLDAMNKSGQWIAPITLQNLNSLNSIDLSKAVKKVAIQQLPIQFSRLITDKIPVFVTRPIGESPRDYQYLDIWPSQLQMTVSGPEGVIQQLKTKGINLTFNLAEIPQEALEELKEELSSDTLTYHIPADWKQIVIPSLSDRPMVIDDPAAEDLHIDFMTSDLHPITKPIPLNFFCHPEHGQLIHPDHISFLTNEMVDRVHGLYLFRKPLYTKGVSRLFVEIVQEMLEITVFLSPSSDHKHLNWSLHIFNPGALEDRFVSTLMTDYLGAPALTKKIEEHLRKRFRHYVHQFQLYKSEHEKLDLVIELKDNQLVIQEEPRENRYH